MLKKVCYIFRVFKRNCWQTFVTTSSIGRKYEFKQDFLTIVDAEYLLFLFSVFVADTRKSFLC